ncbi:hypothetical protein ABW18_02865 [Gordonia jacobaea]|uniref:Uncharacterized protein n=1 Tax=Gordonia jacobaea TaxID=122202 RepID=A0ABR5IHY4_9ACTN|nr:hypothetical protein ABW18_02865 [Gordonia jacobaea]
MVPLRFETLEHYTVLKTAFRTVSTPAAGIDQKSATGAVLQHQPGKADVADIDRVPIVSSTSKQPRYRAAEYVGTIDS